MDPQKAQQSKAAATSAKDAPAGSAGNKKKQGASTAQGRLRIASLSGDEGLRSMKNLVFSRK
jgi:hypothetical protein